MATLVSSVTEDACTMEPCLDNAEWKSFAIVGGHYFHLNCCALQSVNRDNIKNVMLRKRFQFWELGPLTQPCFVRAPCLSIGIWDLIHACNSRAPLLFHLRPASKSRGSDRAELVLMNPARTAFVDRPRRKLAPLVSWFVKVQLLAAACALWFSVVSATSGLFAFGRLQLKSAAAAARPYEQAIWKSILAFMCNCTTQLGWWKV